MQLPEHGDAYNEIYINQKWYGLVPDASLLDPSGTVKKELDINDSGKTVLEHFGDTMFRVVQNQSRLKNTYHGRTYVAYGDGALKRGLEKGKNLANLLTWGRVIWKGIMPSDVTKEELRAAKLLHDSRTGNVRVYLEARKLAVEFEVQKVSRLPASSEEFGLSPHDSKNGIIAGDGTVPVLSAEAQARGLAPGVKGDDAQGVQMAFAQHGYDHQFSYNHPWTRWAVLYSVAQIAQDAPEPSC